MGLFFEFLCWPPKKSQASATMAHSACKISAIAAPAAISAAPNAHAQMGRPGIHDGNEGTITGMKSAKDQSFFRVTL